MYDLFEVNLFFISVFSLLMTNVLTLIIDNILISYCQYYNFNVHLTNN